MNRLTRWCIYSLTLVATAGMAEPPGLLAREIPEAVYKAEQQRIQAIARATTSAVSVFANGGKGGGSGVVATIHHPHPTPNTTTHTQTTSNHIHTTPAE